jgi:hypothetical protein
MAHTQSTQDTAAHLHIAESAKQAPARPACAILTTNMTVRTLAGLGFDIVVEDCIAVKERRRG